MSTKLATIALTALAFAACGEKAPAASGASGSKEPLDPFVVSIDAQRWGVIVDRAMEGAKEAPYADDKVLENQLFNADVALKSAAANLVQLRNEVCAKGLVTGEACTLKDFPAWTREPPSATTSVEEIEKRSHWLSSQLDPFTHAGCEAGKKATNNEQFCSVE
ncbi:MAG TPA: hypothetical protein VG942_02935 [Hyphomonadaceae bacterium]|nr:hypothetical protein [Hyphomonadaceae bacterium]